MNTARKLALCILAFCFLCSCAEKRTASYVKPDGTIVNTVKTKFVK